MDCKEKIIKFRTRDNKVVSFKYSIIKESLYVQRKLHSMEQMVVEPKYIAFPFTDSYTLKKLKMWVLAHEFDAVRNNNANGFTKVIHSDWDDEFLKDNRYILHFLIIGAKKLGMYGFIYLAEAFLKQKKNAEIKSFTLRNMMEKAKQEVIDGTKPVEIIDETNVSKLFEDYIPDLDSEISCSEIRPSTCTNPNAISRWSTQPTTSHGFNSNLCNVQLRHYPMELAKLPTNIKNVSKEFAKTMQLETENRLSGGMHDSNVAESTTKKDYSLFHNKNLQAALNQLNKKLHANKMRSMELSDDNKRKYTKVSASHRTRPELNATDVALKILNKVQINDTEETAISCKDLKAPAKNIENEVLFAALQPKSVELNNCDNSGSNFKTKCEVNASTLESSHGKIMDCEDSSNNHMNLNGSIKNTETQAVIEQPKLCELTDCDESFSSYLNLKVPIKNNESKEQPKSCEYADSKKIICNFKNFTRSTKRNETKENFSSLAPKSEEFTNWEESLSGCKRLSFPMSTNEAKEQPKTVSLLSQSKSCELDECKELICKNEDSIVPSKHTKSKVKCKTFNCEITNYKAMARGFNDLTVSTNNTKARVQFATLGSQSIELTVEDPKDDSKQLAFANNKRQCINLEIDNSCSVSVNTKSASLQISMEELSDNTFVTRAKCCNKLVRSSIKAKEKTESKQLNQRSALEVHRLHKLSRRSVTSSMAIAVKLRKLRKQSKLAESMRQEDSRLQLLTAINELKLEESKVETKEHGPALAAHNKYQRIFKWSEEHVFKDWQVQNMIQLPQQSTAKMCEHNKQTTKQKDWKRQQQKKR